MFEESALNYINPKHLEAQRQKWILLRNHQSTVPYNDWLTSLANNQTILNQALVYIAIEQEANATESSRWLEATILQRRMDGKLLEHIYELLDHREQDPRVIGAMMAMNINQCAQLTNPLKQQCFEALIAAFDEEPSIYAQTWILSAIATYNTNQSVDFLLQHTSSRYHAIRLTIADIIAYSRPKLDQMRPETTQGILRLAADPSSRVAWNILWEIAQHPQLFHHARQPLIEVARRQAQSSNTRLRDVATQVVDVLSHFTIEHKQRQLVRLLKHRQLNHENSTQE